MAEIFIISGFYKDNKEDTFSRELVTNIDSLPEGFEEEEIFWYGLEESELQEMVDEYLETGDNSGVLPFVVTSFDVF